MIENKTNLHQASDGRITSIVNCINRVNRNYPENTATKIGLETAASGTYKERYLKELNKEVGIQENPNRPDFSDLGIGKEE